MNNTANQNSLFNRYSRYVGGGVSEISNQKIEWWERAELERDSTDTVYAVEDFYDGRPDLIASAFYNEPRYWWIIAQYNNILDPFSEIRPGRILLIPSKERIPLLLLNKQGGTQSQRESIETLSPIII